MEFGVKYANSGRAYILVGVKFVTTDRHADTIWFCLARTHGADEVGIGDFVSCWNLVGTDKKDGLIAGNMSLEGTVFGDTLSTATPFIGE